MSIDEGYPQVCTSLGVVLNAVIHYGYLWKGFRSRGNLHILE